MAVGPGPGVKCNNCQFFEKDKEPVTDGGACHRFPPSISRMEIVVRHLPVRTTKDNWCGEFVAEVATAAKKEEAKPVTPQPIQPPRPVTPTPQPPFRR